MDDQAQAVGSIDDRITAALLGPVEKEPEAPQEAQQEAPQEAQEEPQAEDSGEPEEPQSEAEAPQSWEEVKAIKLKVPLKNGAEEREEEVSIDELRLGYMRQSDYQRKTQEAALARKTAQEEAMKEVATFRDKTVSELKTLEAWIAQVAAPEMQGVNWNTLATSDPAEFVRLSHRANQLQVLKQQVSQKLQQAEQQRISEESAKRAQALEQAQERLATEIPNWSADLQQALVKSGREYGFSDDELARIDDPKVVKLLHDAHQWKALQAKGPIAEKKVVSVPKVLKSGAAPSKGNQQRVQYEALRTRVKKSGGKDHAAVEELIKSRLGA